MKRLEDKFLDEGFINKVSMMLLISLYSMEDVGDKGIDDRVLLVRNTIVRMLEEYDKKLRGVNDK